MPTSLSAFENALPTHPAGPNNTLLGGHALGLRRMLANGLRCGLASQLGQRGLHVLRRDGARLLRQALREPFDVEVIAPSTFRRLAGEKGVREQITQQRGLDLPALAPGAISVVDMAGVALAPKVKQGIRWAGVKADGVLAIQDAHVRNPAPVEDHGARGAAQPRLVEGGYPPQH